jgi:hypothetical protein
MLPLSFTKRYYLKSAPPSQYWGNFLRLYIPRISKKGAHSIENSTPDLLTFNYSLSSSSGIMVFIFTYCSFKLTLDQQSHPSSHAITCYYKRLIIVTLLMAPIAFIISRFLLSSSLLKSLLTALAFIPLHLYCCHGWLFGRFSKLLEETMQELSIQYQ